MSDKITPREMDVWKFASLGYSNQGIADIFVLTSRTVSNTLNGLYSKLDLTKVSRGHAKRVQLVRMYFTQMNGGRV